ncbi:glycoside hydrolase/phage tail family protein [Stappia sp. F7233]|uniref:Glycoside hydrolase/phage tail family protein n=1 Tax=Stappia albiluteola TaxID=2758565 RepID=A0A839A9Y9_9HYPH|nr:glycoside hydrolase/phage tail family protein [Stappia albiluteola]MBA5776373.1 glycoside hydrolase/phage tail family protein [Stappia albiluteola]
MATLVLTAAGQAIGAAIGGPIGAAIGQTVGAIAGSYVDQALFGGGSGRTVEGGRLADLNVQSSTEGTAIPLAYGRVRLSGQVIWATRFEEEVTEERQGGKGGGRKSATVRTYRYFANFAVALCQGPIHHVGRVWADGKPLDLATVTMRVHRGEADQLPDPLIAARQGETPAYRGIAYVVFERLPLEDFGNRLPQLAFEVIRAVGDLEEKVRAVTLIPAAGEFVYHPSEVTRMLGPGAAATENRHVLQAPSNFVAALDELTAICPNLESVALAVAWFGDDLNCGTCTIRPKTEGQNRATRGATWSVNGLSRPQAEVVSPVDGRPAYGGTPSDASVVAAIRELKARGLKVALYPFLLMDIPPQNGLTDPYGGTEQPAFPWRGRITGSVGEAAAGTEIAAFTGLATRQHFTRHAETVSYSGPVEWSYRRFILHHAHLAEVAGGVDAFLIGSEMRGLTQLHDDEGAYPFVTALKALAGEVRQVVGAGTKITYAADWSEYGSHQPEPGSLRFPLDPLWADEVIDMVGIDNYLPIADQRDDGDPDGNSDPYDIPALRSQIAGGEYFDWFYASNADRRAGLRSPISDGAYGKPFVYRAKDIAGWWANPHHERDGGVERTAPTPWQAGMKPVWFTELGFPAVDKGANQPNVFPDPKSSESALPYFSNGGRDDLLQRRALEAVLGYWDGEGAPTGTNPVSPVYGGPMVDPAGTYLWAFDVRPYPDFPARGDIWSDGANWRGGHWLNGRLGGVTLDAFAKALAGDLGLDAGLLAEVAPAVVLEGIALSGPISLRQAIEPLIASFGLAAADRGSDIALLPAWRPPVATLGAGDLAEPGAGEALVSRHRNQDSDLPAEIRIAGRDPQREHRRHVAASRRLEGAALGISDFDLGAVAGPEVLGRAADKALIRLWAERETCRFALSPHRLDLEPGDVVEIGAVAGSGLSASKIVRIEEIEDGPVRLVSARVAARPPVVTREERGEGGKPRSITTRSGPPEIVLLDLPALPGDTDAGSPRVAAYAAPWPGALGVFRQTESGALSAIATVESPATMGLTVTPLAAGPVWRFDNASTVEVELFGGVLASRTRQDVLGGANSAAIVSDGGGLEILQFRTAELVGPGRYRLGGLLRGQLGTEAAAASGHAAGARFVLLNDAVTPLPLAGDRIGLDLTYRFLAEGRALDDPSAVVASHAASGRGLSPLSPVHPRGRRLADGSVRFSWVRRTRRDGDGWIGLDVPLGEEAEAYELDLLAEDGTVAATLASDAPQAVLSVAEELAAFGGVQDVFRLRLAQLSRAVGRGQVAEAEIRV